jgi:hypothetical protein
VRLKIDHVRASGRVRDGATAFQKKDGRPVEFEIAEETRIAIGEVNFIKIQRSPRSPFHKIDA